MNRLLLLLVLVSLPYLTRLTGNYLYDDIQVIESNRHLKAVKNFKDIFHFQLKPSKPVTNFLIATGHWIGKGSIVPHRILSLLFHLGCVMLLYLILQCTPAAFWTALLYGLLPIHSEAFGVILFRMEIVATFFCLLAVWSLYQKSALWSGVTFITTILSALSKESFAIITPITLICFIWLTSMSNRVRKTGVVGFSGLVFSILIIALLQLDSKSDFPYQDVIGIHLIDPIAQVKWAASSLVEGLYKVVTGQMLSIHRLKDRPHWAFSFGMSFALLIPFFIFPWKYRAHPWVLATWAAIAFYLFLPNLNVGSEHYWYFPSIGVVMGIVFLAFKFFKKSHYATLLLTVYIFSLSTGLYARLRIMGSKIEFYAREAELYPTVPSTWSDLAIAVMEKGPEHLKLAAPLLEKAYQIAPDHPNVISARFLYFFYNQDLQEMRKIFAQVEERFAYRPIFMGRFHYHMGVVEAAKGDKQTARIHFQKARDLDPGNPYYAETKLTLN